MGESELLLFRACLGVCKLQRLWRCTPSDLGQRDGVFVNEPLFMWPCGGGLKDSLGRGGSPPLCLEGNVILAGALQTQLLEDEILGFLEGEVPLHSEV